MSRSRTTYVLWHDLERVAVHFLSSIYSLSLCHFMSFGTYDRGRGSGGVSRELLTYSRTSLR